jgi:hypothetical protein
MKKDEVRLNEFDKTEWFVISRAINPDITEAEFEIEWKEFQRLKKAKKLS